MLGASGTMVYTHEMTHNSMVLSILKGMVNEGEGPESFATGMLESATNVSEKGLVLTVSIREIKIRPAYHTWRSCCPILLSRCSSWLHAWSFDVLNSGLCWRDIVTGVLTDQQKWNGTVRLKIITLKTSYGKQAHVDDRIVPYNCRRSSWIQNLSMLCWS